MSTDGATTIHPTGCHSPTWATEEEERETRSPRNTSRVSTVNKKDITRTSARMRKWKKQEP
jgi:hypothetical protein